MSIEMTLTERGRRYGSFEDQACITQALKAIMSSRAGWDRLSSGQKEALDMIANKIGRILNGDPNYADSWHDIAGYAKLVDDRLVEAEARRATEDELARVWAITNAVSMASA